MDIREENRYSMLLSVDSFLQRNLVIVNEIQAFAEAAGEFHNILPIIREKDIEYLNAVRGVVENKDTAQLEMIHAVMQAAKALKIYARRNGMNDIKELVKVSESDLKNMRDNDMFSRTKSISAKSAELSEALISFGWTTEKQTMLEGKIADYQSKFMNKDVSYAEKSALRRELTGMMSEAGELLHEELDEFAEMLQYSNPVFFDGYRAASVVKDLGLGHDDPEPEPDDEEG